MQGNPNPESSSVKSGTQLPLKLESSTWNRKSTAWNPKSKTVLHSLTWGDQFNNLVI